MKAKAQNRKKSWRRTALIAGFWLLIWEVAYLLIGRDVYFPAPLSVLKLFLELLTDEKTWKIIAMSTYRTSYALLLSVALGVSTGLACGLSRRLYDLLNPLVVVLKSTPVVSVIILAILWFPSSEVPVFSGLLMCYPIVFVSTVAGIRNTDLKLMEMADFYRLRGRDKLFSLYLPSALPYINASVVSAIGICWKAVAAAEVLSMPRNAIGANLFFAKTALDPALLFAWTAMIILLSFVFEALYARISGYDKTARNH